jgi:hypothetical protein
MSPKLFSVSGEVGAVDPNVIKEYVTTQGCSSILKFVANGTKECWDDIDMWQIEIYDFFKENEIGYPPEIWIMPVGATKDVQELSTVGEISIEAMKRGYNVATRNHCYVFGNVIGK